MRRRRHNRYLGAVIVLSVLAVICIAAIIMVAIPGGNLLNLATATPLATENTTAAPTAAATDPSASPIATEKASGQATIQMCGDILLHDSSRESGKQADGSYNYDSYFEAIKPSLTGDLIIANLEGPINAKGDGTGYSGYPNFNMPEAIVTAAKNAGINFFVTANNHCTDMKKDGLVQSHDNLKKLGVDFTGIYTSQQEYDAPVVREINGIKVGIINYTYGLNGIYTEDNIEYYTRVFDQETKNTKDLQRMYKDIDAVRGAGAEFIIFSMHWGAEYTYTPSTVERWYAQNLSEYGVDVIMGSHSHCVQNIRNLTTTAKDGTKQNTVIIYSLGNFFADQIALTENGTTDSRIRQAMIVNISITRQADNSIAITDASYTPTFIHRDGTSPKYSYRILPAGAYANAATRPSVFDSDAKWTLCKDAWTNVQNVVGKEIKVKEQ